MTDAALVTYMDIPDAMEDEYNDWYTNAVSYTHLTLPTTPYV